MESLPRCPVSDSDPRPEVRARAVLTQAEVGPKKSIWGAVALLLAELARRGHLHPEMRPKPSPTKQGRSTALQGRHSPTTGRKGGSQGSKPCAAARGPPELSPTPPRPQANAARYPGRIFGFKIFGGESMPGRVFHAGVFRGTKRYRRNF